MPLQFICKLLVIVNIIIISSHYGVVWVPNLIWFFLSFHYRTSVILLLIYPTGECLTLSPTHPSCTPPSSPPPLTTVKGLVTPFFPIPLHPPHLRSAFITNEITFYLCFPPNAALASTKQQKEPQQRKQNNHAYNIYQTNAVSASTKQQQQPNYPQQENHADNTTKINKPAPHRQVQNSNNNLNNDNNTSTPTSNQRRIG